MTQQAPLSMGLSKQENWSGLSCSPPGDLPDPGMEPRPLISPALAGRFFTTSATWEALFTTPMRTKTEEAHRHFRHMQDLKKTPQTYERTINMEYMKRCSNSEGKDPR